MGKTPEQDGPDANIITSPSRHFGSSSEPMGVGIIRYTIDTPHILNVVKILSDRKNPINLMADAFLFDRLLRLRQRENFDDALLDANLILEALLLPQGNDRELTYRLRLHASIILAKNLAEFKDLYKYFGILYGLRSAIVHGGADWYDTYKELAKKVVKWNFESYSGEKMVEMTQRDVINDLFEKILGIFSRILETKQKFPQYLEKIENMIGLLHFDPREPINALIQKR